MTKEELNQLATVNDLHGFYQKIVTEIKKTVTENNLKELYTPREFEAVTGMKYTTVILYCNNGKIKARQDGNGGTWLIARSEIDRFITEAEENTAY